jgi:glutamate-1-semialdehyde 2,1-aminomutase
VGAALARGLTLRGGFVQGELDASVTATSVRLAAALETLFSVCAELQRERVAAGLSARDAAPVLIFDEVMTGFRIAKGGVQEREGITPDLTCLGKIIGGGLPVGAFGGRADIMDYLAPLGPVYQAGTLSGNPLAMAAGIASLRLLEELNPYPRLDQLGRQLCTAVADAAQAKGIAVQTPYCGSMFSFFFTPTPVRDYDTALTGDAKLFGRFFRGALENGVYLAPSAYEAGFISTAHGGAAIDRACEVLSSVIREL